jgi:hypothetical protein
MTSAVALTATNDLVLQQDKSANVLREIVGRLAVSFPDRTCDRRCRPAEMVQMKSALRLVLLIATLLAGIAGVSAQTLFVSPTGKDKPPVAVSGWRYEKAPNDVHMFICEQASCIPGSKVSYRFYPAGDSMTLEAFRSSQQQVAKALEQRSPGQRITILGVEGDSGTAVPRMFKARRKTVAADGSSEYVVSGMLFGSKAAASVISSSRDEKASNDNFALFAVAVMLFVSSAKQ